MSGITLKNGGKFTLKRFNKLKVDENINRESTRFLSTSQKAAITQIATLHELSKVKSRIGGIMARTKPLLVGASGAGKSAAVRIFAEDCGKRVLSVNSGSWIPYGARNEATLEVVKKFIVENWEQGGVLFLDEIDKCISHTHVGGMSEWSLSVFTELLALLDGDERLSTMGWDHSVLSVYRTGVFFAIGAGAWQHLKKESSRRHVGFGRDEVNSDYRESVVADFGIPEEIGKRFSSDIILIDFPTEDDFCRGIASIRKEMGLPTLNGKEMRKMSNTAVASNLGVRWLESYLTEMLRDSGNMSGVPRGDISFPAKPIRVIRVDAGEIYKTFAKMLHDVADLATAVASEIHLTRSRIYEGTDNVIELLCGKDGVTTDSERGLIGVLLPLVTWSRELSVSLFTANMRQFHEELWEKYICHVIDCLEKLISTCLKEIRGLGLYPKILRLHNLSKRTHCQYQAFLKAGAI